MVSTSENTFGAVLRRSQDVQTYISGFEGYNPPRPNETAEKMMTLINAIIATNGLEAVHHENYKAAVDARKAAFAETPESVQKLLYQIKGAVEAQYGKKSTEAVVINAIVKKMRDTKLQKTSDNPEKPDQAKKISQSERSFGSITQLFSNIISNLTQFNAFNPSNSAIKIPALQATAAQLTILNNDVAQKMQQLKTIRATRQKQYADLKDRVRRIKAYVKSQYGNTSTEYNLIKSLSV